MKLSTVQRRNGSTVRPHVLPLGCLTAIMSHPPAHSVYLIYIRTTWNIVFWEVLLHRSYCKTCQAVLFKSVEGQQKHRPFHKASPAGFGRLGKAPSMNPAAAPASTPALARSRDREEVWSCRAAAWSGSKCLGLRDVLGRRGAHWI